MITKANHYKMFESVFLLKICYTVRGGVMRVEDLIVYGKSQIHSDFARMLLADLLNMNTLELYTHLDDLVSEEIETKYRQKVALLQQEKPIQYVMGNVNFYGLSFLVDERVLIPRFETEELVENTVQLIHQTFGDKPVKIIDLGCGSGVIGLTLKKLLPSSEVVLLDISDCALEVAKENAKRLQLDVRFILGDMLENIQDKFDVIISNPPYIEDDEEIQELVRKNEPSIALFGGKDGLDLYRKIFRNCSGCLKTPFLLAFEIGYKQKERLVDLAYQTFPNATIECKKDLSGRDRMLFVVSNSAIF